MEDNPSLGKDVIEMYEPYRVLDPKLKTTTVSYHQFEVDEHYILGRVCMHYTIK